MLVLLPAGHALKMRHTNPFDVKRAHLYICMHVAYVSLRRIMYERMGLQSFCRPFVHYFFEYLELDRPSEKGKNKQIFMFVFVFLINIGQRNCFQY